MGGKILGKISVDHIGLYRFENGFVYKKKLRRRFSTVRFLGLVIHIKRLVLGEAQPPDPGNILNPTGSRVVLVNVSE